MVTEFAEELRSYLRGKKITQERFADLAKLNPSIISRILKGKQNGMHLDTYKRIKDTMRDNP